MDLEIALLDDDVGLRASHELTFTDKFARMFDQCG